MKQSSAAAAAAQNPQADAGLFMVSAGAVIENQSTGKILLLKRASSQNQAGEWELARGRLENGETVDAGLRREVAEETGISDLTIVAPLTTQLVATTSSKLEYEVIVITFICQTSQVETAVSAEHDEARWVEPSEALQLVKMKGVRLTIEAYIAWKKDLLATQQLQEQAARAVADYQNLVRRNAEDRTRLIKLASSEFAQALLEPLEHLSMAAMVLNDPGLNMVVKTLWDRLADQGLEEINPLGMPFDVATMEAVEGDGSSKLVTKVIRKGYALHGQVIQHAKVSTVPSADDTV